MQADVCRVVPSHWRVLPIEKVCTRVTSGGTPSRRISAYYTGGQWPWVKTQELTDRWLDDTEEHITDEAIAKSSAKVLPTNTLLLALYGATIGQLGIIRRPMTCNQACCVMVVDDTQADFRYLYYQLIHARPLLKQLATGAAQQNLSGKLMKSLCLPFPALDEQRAIADILGCLDDKIELNRRMNQTLEAMARGIFKSWFIDFDPVRYNQRPTSSPTKPSTDPTTPSAPHPHNDATPAHPHTPNSATNLHAQIAAHFPSTFQDSLLGPIPEGWDVRELGEICEFAYGKALKGSDRREGPYPVFGSNGIMGWHDEALVRGPGIVIGRKGNPGTVQWTQRDFFAIDTTFFIRVDDYPNLLPYLRYALEILDLPGLSADSAVPGLNRNMAYRSPMLLPPPQLREAFAEQCKSMHEKSLNNDFEAATLAALRDALLPKLLSGELPVSEAEKLAGEGV